MKAHSRYYSTGITALVVVAVDQFSKWYVVERLNLRELLAIDVIPPFLNFRMAWNTGINFGMLGGGGEVGRMILIALALIAVLALLYWSRQQTDRLFLIATGATIGGALGNVWDRMTLGAVADFLNMSCCGIMNPFSFNIADIAIFLGLIVIIWRGGLTAGEPGSKP